MNIWYKDYSEYLAERFPGVKVQKISVNAGFSCPNRDGTIGVGGCIYCDNRSFTPGYCMTGDAVAEQLRKGKEFFSRKYPRMKYLAYFQSFTGTYSHSTELLQSLYAEALSEPDIVGLVIGTRPDTLPDEVIDLLSEINSRVPVFVELGVETSSDETLRLINRNHTWQDVMESVSRLVDMEIEVGVHLIAGLPGEDKERVLQSIRDVCALPVHSIKLHQMQVIRDTVLHQKILSGELSVPSFTLDEYLDLCVEIVKIVPRHIAIERFLASAPPQMVIAPKWGLKNHEFTDKLHNRLASIEQNPSAIH